MPKTDVLGRVKGKTVTNDTIALLNSEIFYKTVGDHATMLPEKIRYTLPTQTGTLTPTTCVDYTYDESGNITSITYTGHGNSMAYTYDKFNRLIREDDKELRRTMVYTYDGDGNITSKQQMVYQTETPAPGVNAITYTYSNGKMTKYNGLTCSYDAVGNPTVYKGQRATWTKGRKLASYRNTTFTYDGRGRRISKNSTTYTYDSADRLIKTSNGMEFFYDQEGVAGFTYGGAKYCYQKDLQGNIIGIIDNAGQVVVQYKYDAWGMPRGTTTVSTEYSTIASLNPFRYRGYIYDSETGFYYLQSRYYDPETCRFLNMDSVDYADPEMLNGLNLYAYGLNNPVMYVDPTGHMPEWASWVLWGVTIAGFALATVATCGAFGAVGVTIGAAVLTGGVISGGVNAIDQLHDNGSIDLNELGIATLSGQAYGLVMGLTGGNGGWAVAGKLAVAGGTSLLNSWNEEKSFSETAVSFVGSLALSGAIQTGAYFGKKILNTILPKITPSITKFISKIFPKNPNHLITMKDIGGVLWEDPAIHASAITGSMRFIGGVVGALFNDFF